MRQFKRLFYYLLINVIISTLTVWAVLTFINSRQAVPSGITGEGLLVPAEGLFLTEQPESITDNSATHTDSPLQTPTINLSTNPLPTIGLIPYLVQEGDSLGGIAVKFEVSMADLMAVNNIDNPDRLLVGQTIFIPSAPLPEPSETALPSLMPSPSLTASPRPSSLPSPTGTQSADVPGIVIVGVIGTGDLDTERIIFKRTGAGVLSLANWRLEDGNGNVYLFPVLTLYKGGSINLHTTAGLDSVNDLFWGLTAAVWDSGEMILLRDDQGRTVASYQVP
jgi:LysM repeat protein